MKKQNKMKTEYSSLTTPQKLGRILDVLHNEELEIEEQEILRSEMQTLLLKIMTENTE